MSKKFFYSLAVAVLVLMGLALLFIHPKQKNPDKSVFSVVASNFASYDFLRAIIGDDSEVKLIFLLGPGKDAHSFDPSPQDVVTIADADLFVYIGGEMEQWTDRVLTSTPPKGKSMKISDFVATAPEKPIDDMQEEEEDEHEHEAEGAFDEHIWTSPANAVAMLEALGEQLCEVRPAKCETYRQNAARYRDQIQQVDAQISAVVAARTRDRLVFADKMPMQYFIDYYGLQVSAAFDGCSSDSEPSAKTIAALEDRIRSEHIPVVLYIELNPGRVAQLIASDVGNCTPLQIQTLHNVSREDFENGETWVSLMSRNVEVLRQALQ